jgi:hypothetical protein
MLSSLLSNVRSFDGGHALGQANNPEQPSDGITAALRSVRVREWVELTTVWK